MSEWFHHICGKYRDSSVDNSVEKNGLSLVMIPKVTLLLVLIFGVTFSVLVSFLPKITRWLEMEAGPRPLTLGDVVGVAPSLSLNRHDTCGASPEIHQEVKRHQTSVQPTAFKADKNENTGEALAALALAKDMIHQGKKEKALKLLQHALNLAPQHPDILNEYGEFLENTKKDIVSAEHMYCRALSLSPSHTRALSNRQRTLPLVHEMDQNALNRIDHKRKLLFQVPENHPAMRRMKKESYFRHIYHTTAIEGNTFNLMQTRLLVETRVAIGGKSLMEHQEIMGMDAALSYINSSLIHRIGELTVNDIKEIHKRVLGFVDPIGAGHLRTTQVFVGEFMPPAPRDVPNLIREFIEWINSDEALRLHPVELAALAHYRLVYIHPFYDGNGRTSRLLMNLILMQAGFPPVTIKVEEKQDYYHHLQTANDGDVRPFIRFIAKCTERTLDEYLWATSENSSAFPGIMDASDHRVIVVGDDDDDDDVDLVEEHEYVHAP